MSNKESKKTNPSENCTIIRGVSDAALQILRNESTYTGFDDDHEDSPHWMDRNHDYGGED